MINNINIFSQSASRNITDGNEKYNSRQFSSAEVEYHKALSKDSTEFIANYNLGNSLYKQGKYSDALQYYNNALANAKKNKKLDENQLAAAFHNVGNSLLSQKQYEQSIQAYKNALKINPKDNETRYNLAYAQQFLKKPPPDKQNQQQKNDKNQQNQQQNQQQQQQPKMDKTDAQQLLNALMQDEKQTKENAQKAVQPNRQQPDKDW
ncbi:MAG: tetratricopeptide repeat protein [Paludibacter sp.]|nr:tetratricopeptide repeat protein [Paludibacter sp.]